MCKVHLYTMTLRSNSEGRSTKPWRQGMHKNVLNVVPGDNLADADEGKAD